MFDPGQAQTIDVSSLGVIARQALDTPRRWRVGAVFARAFYLNDAHDWICVLPESMGAGPLHMCCRLMDGVDWTAAGIELGMQGRFQKNTLKLDGRIIFDLSAAETWQPQPPPSWTMASAANGLAELETLSAARLPDDGLSRLVFSGPGEEAMSRVAQAAAPMVQALASWLQSSLNQPGKSSHALPDMSGLVGLGPGLTPSGDDFLCGVVVALQALQRRDLADSLSEAVVALAWRNTSPISAAYLEAARDGSVSSCIHRLLHDLLVHNSASLAQSIDGIDGLGHTSGWETLAGIVLTFRAQLNRRHACPGLDDVYASSLHPAI